MAEGGGHGPAESPWAGLAEDELQQRLARLDALLDRLEQASGPVAGTALEAVEALTEVYGTALARVMSLAGVSPSLVSRLASDELLSHLLMLHGLHPDPVADRVARALQQIAPYLRAQHAGAELAGVSGGVARVTVSGGGCRTCSASTGALEETISDAILTFAPELSDVQIKLASRSARPAPALIPAESLLRKPGTPGPAPAAARSGAR